MLFLSLSFLLFISLTLNTRFFFLIMKWLKYYSFCFCLFWPPDAVYRCGWITTLL
jgi:hypothetical protein